MTKRKQKFSMEQARRYLDKWLPRMGFAHWAVDLRVLPESARNEVWGRSLWLHEEESASVQVVPDDVLPDEQMEVLILHELAHGLVRTLRTYGFGGPAEEMVVNRIVRLALDGKPVTMLNMHSLLTDDSDDGWLALERIQVDRLRELIDRLPEREREVINRWYYEKQSLSRIARDLELGDATGARRVLGQAHRKLGELMEEA